MCSVGCTENPPAHALSYGVVLVAHSVLRAEPQTVCSEALEQPFSVTMPWDLPAEVPSRNAHHLALSLLHNLLKAFVQPEPDRNANEALVPHSERLDGSAPFHFDEDRKRAAGGKIEMLERVLHTAQFCAHRGAYRFQAIPKAGTVAQNAIQQSVPGRFIGHLQHCLFSTSLCPPAGRLVTAHGVLCKGGLDLVLRGDLVSGAWRVVVADDYPDAADTLALALDTFGCTPFIARDGPTALDLVRQHRPHAALLELSLPGMAGWDVARLLRRDPITTRTVMITVTAWGRKSDRVQAELCGFDAFVLKPATASDILRLIAAHCGQRD